MQWLNDPLCRSGPAGESFTDGSLSGWIYKLPLRLKQLYCRFLEKSPWPCSWALYAPTSNLIPCDTSSARAKSCVSWKSLHLSCIVSVCVYLCVAAKFSTDPIFSSHVSCPRQQLSHKAPPAKHMEPVWVSCLSVSLINNMKQKS